LHNRIDKQIDELVDALTDAIIVWPGGWADTLPDWIKSEIQLERLAQNMKSLRGERMTATDAEACAYLYTRSLEGGPIDSDWTQIYLYVAGKTASRGKNAQIPDDIKVDSLNNYQLGLLRDLKDWIYEHRVKVRQEKRKEKKAQAIAETKTRAPQQLKLGV